MKSTMTAMNLARMLVPGKDARTASATGHGQVKPIRQPDVARERDAKGFVFINDGFTAARVDAGLDDKFERIDNGMSTRVRMTDRGGDARLNPSTGTELLEEDGRF